MILKIDEINVNYIVMVLFSKKSFYYIHNLLLDFLRNFLKTISFLIKTKSNKTITNEWKSIKIALNGINR